MSTSSERKLNLGSGFYPKPGYVNLDVNPRQKPDIFRDVRRGLPFDTNSIKEVSATHLLEHLSPPEVLDLIEEVYRVLIPGGEFHIGVPLGLTGCLDHRSIYEEHSFDQLSTDDAPVYFNRSFRWQLVTKQVLDDNPRWRTLCVELRAVK